MRDAHEGACELREHARDGGARGSAVTGDASAGLDTEDVLFLCHRTPVRSIPTTIVTAQPLGDQRCKVRWIVDPDNEQRSRPRSVRG
jgi:hypothetical protein